MGTTPKPARRPRVRRFTESWLHEQLGKARPAREEWGDSGKPGLRVRFGKTGTITWVHYRTAGGKSALIILGRYPELGLQAAHARLDLERSRARQGLTGLEVAGNHADWTVEALVTKFGASLHAHRKTASRAEKTLRLYVLDRRHGFKHLRARDVAKPAWHAIVEEIAAAGHATQASQVHRLLGQMFNFGLQLGVLEVSPFQGLRGRTLGAVEPPPRQRALAVDELQQLLQVLSETCQPDARTTRAALQILLLTGKRTGETLLARWEDVDLEGRVWTIPEANRKAPMNISIGDELVPLAPAAVAVFEQLKELAGNSPWVFRSPHSAKTGHLGVTALSRTIRDLRKAKLITGPRWTPHDLRRTARSYWSEKLSVPWDLAERLLGHALPKIARTYDAGVYLEQRRAALEKWAAYLEQLERRDGKVVVLPTGRA